MSRVVVSGIIAILGFGFFPSPLFYSTALAEQKICADGSRCAETGEPSDAELEDSCSDDAEVI